MDDLPNEILLMCMPEGHADALACVCHRWRDVLVTFRPMELVSESAKRGRISILVWLCEVAPTGWPADAIHAALRVAIVSGREGALKVLLDGPVVHGPKSALDARLPTLAAARGDFDAVERLCSAGCPHDDWTYMVLGAVASPDQVERFIIRHRFRSITRSFLGALILGRIDVLRVFHLCCFASLEWNDYLSIFAPPDAVEWMDARYRRTAVRESMMVTRARSLIQRHPDLVHPSKRSKIVRRMLKAQQRAHEDILVGSRVVSFPCYWPKGPG